MLSVVAQQILSILQALSTLSSQFVFEGNEIKLINSCGIFITMNPGEEGAFNNDIRHTNYAVWFGAVLVG